MQTYAEIAAAVKRADGPEFSLEDYKMVHWINQAFAAEKGRYMDSNETMALVRSLTQFLNRVYQVKINADLKFMTALPMLPEGVAPGARKLGWLTQEDLGAIDFLSNGAGDLKTLSLTRDEKILDIKIAGGRIAWTWQDVEAAIFQGVPLPSELGMTARRLVDLFHDTTTAKGNAAYGVEGLLTSTSTMTHATDITWSGLTTVDDKVAAVQTIIRGVSSATSRVFTANLCILPPSYFQELEDGAYGANKDKSGLDYLEFTYRRRQMQILEWQQFAGVTLPAESLSNKDMIMAFPFTPEAGENMIVDPFMMKPPKEDENYNVSAGVFTKTAGVVKRQPKAFVWAKLN